MRSNAIVCYMVICAMLVNYSGATFMIAATGLSVIYTNVAQAQTPVSDTPLLDELNTKHGLADSQRNHQSDSLPQNIQDQVNSYQPYQSNTALGNTLSNVLANKVPSKYSETDIKNKYPQTFGTNAPSFNQYTDSALNLSKTHGQPSGNVVGNKLESLNVDYSRSGTRRFVRNPTTGAMEIEVITGVPKVTGIPDSQLFSEEIASPEYGFETDKESLYGDQQGILNEGKASYDNFKDPTVGKNASGRGFRAITSGATRANDVSIDESAAWLQPSFDELQTAQDPNMWISACSDTTTTENQTYTYGEYTDHVCQDTSQSNFDFCEVERKIIVPAYSSNPGLRSCGPGCYEFDMHVDTWKSSRCRETYPPANEAPPALFDIDIDFDKYALGSVTLNGVATDHFKFSLNNNSIWASYGGSIQATVGQFYVGGCNITNANGGAISTDVTQTVANIVNPVGTQTLSFRGDLMWKQNGSMDVVIKIQLVDLTGDGFETTHIQYPEGCYDALQDTDKQTRGLSGVYDWKEIGIYQGTPPTYYQCESPASQPTCGIGEVLFGDPLSEMCYSQPIKVPACTVGVLNVNNTLCTYDADLGTCPLGGTLQGAICELPVIQQDACLEVDQTLSTLMMFGTSETKCASNPIGNTPNNWSCSPSGSAYSSTYCSISRETYLDENAQLIKRYDPLGYLLPQQYDSDGLPITFTDVAFCSIGGAALPPDPTTVPKSFCTFDSYDNILENDAGFPTNLLNKIPPFYAGDVGEKTWRVNLKGYRCDPTGGKIMCIPDEVTGVDVCYSWEDLRNRPNQCDQFSTQANCQEVSRECSDGWEELITGRCMSESVAYKCLQDVDVDYVTTSTSNVCDAMLPCSGGECEIGQKESNDKFVEAMVAGSILDNMQGDSNCEDPTDPDTCTIFDGEYEYCSWEVTGLGTDCCEAAKGIDILAYVTLARGMLKVNQMAASGAFGNGVSGAYESLATPVTDGYQAISNWASEGIRSASESIFGNTESVSGASSVAGDGIKAALASVQQQAYQLVYDIAPQALNDFLFSNAAAYAQDNTTELVFNEAIGNFMSNVMAVYAAYQMFKLALTLLTACDDNEIDMSVKIGQRQCFKVGNRYCSKDVLGVCYQRRQSYCCYNSILSRIIMSEAYGQLGKNPLPFGNKPNMLNGEADASCPGLTPAELKLVDFSNPSMQTALEEWVGLMLGSGEIATETSEQYLTGGAVVTQKTNCPLQQTPVLTCYIDTISGDEICNQQRDASGNIIYQSVPTDCGGELTGGGQIWNASDRVTITERITGTNGYIGNASDRVQETKDAMRALPGNIDCSIVPRPPVCDLGFDPVQP